MRKAFDSRTRLGRIGDAALDTLYGAVVVAAGLFGGAWALVAMAETDEWEPYLLLAAAALMLAVGLWFLRRAVMGR